MADYWEENLQVASLGGQKFPMRTLSRTGGRRTVGHQYPYRDGQDTEDLGRLPLKWEIEVPLFRGMDPIPYVNVGSGEQLYPDVYDNLRAIFDVDNFGEVEFIDPELGPVQVKVVQHRWSMVSDQRAGGVFRLSIEENNDEPFIFRLNTFSDARQVATTLAQDIDEGLAEIGIDEDDVANEWNDAGIGLEGSYDPDTLFVTSVDEFFEALDGGAEAVDVIAGRVDAVRERIDLLMAFDAMQEATSWSVYYSAMRMADTLGTVAEQFVDSSSGQIVEYVVPWGPLTHWELALLLYGDRDRVDDILRLNKIANPLAIPAGTVLRVQTE